MDTKVNYGKGILGGLVFGIIASIPWILIYVFVNMFVAYLGALIGLGVIFGYKKFINKIDKKMPLIVILIILFIVVLNAMVVIPGILLIQNGIPFSISNLILLYEIEGVLPSLIKDLLMSIVFAALGAVPYINSINVQIKNNDPNSDINPIYNSSALVAEYMKNIREYFIKKSATDKKHAIPITDDLHFNEIALKNLKFGKGIVEVDGLYYYDLEKGTKIENDYTKLAIKSNNPFSKKSFIILIIVVIIIALISVLFI